MDWQLRAMQTMGQSDQPWDYWLLFRTGNISEPVAVIRHAEMKKLVEEFHEYEARLEKERK